MKLFCAAALTLTAILCPIVSSKGAFAGEQSKLVCSKPMISAAGIVYDRPGGGEIGYVSFDVKVVDVARHRQADGGRWILLGTADGAHIGWIMLKGTRLTITCTPRRQGGETDASQLPP